LWVRWLRGVRAQRSMRRETQDASLKARRHGENQEKGTAEKAAQQE
jgi:hypothetical protein